MNTKQKAGCVFSTIKILVTTPIWYYLLFQIMKSVGASDVMWLLFWIYLPVGFVVALVEVIATSIFDSE